MHGTRSLLLDGVLALVSLTAPPPRCIDDSSPGFRTWPCDDTSYQSRP
ncbi:hypothetical protein ACFV8T_35570 [Streptomyces sp. NPDC059832]